MKTDPIAAAPASAPGNTSPATFLPVFWHPRPIPLAPEAVVARGTAAEGLAQRLLARSPDSLATLTGVRSDSLLVVIGATENLPWTDGALYLGRDPAAPGIFVPTTLAPDVPLPLLLRAITARFPNTHAPFAVLPGVGDTAPTVVPLAAARTVDPGLLTGWPESRR